VALTMRMMDSLHSLGNLMFLLLFPPYNETPDDDLNSIHIAEQVQKVTASVCASNMI
jgi:hypothetical protein